ncbi:MFS transporter [Sphaerochaeta sp. PS]|uniref:MFS transporter n=1 Tax=Sphaerochaeta sp. PS TaxID=3076336 RepID=UPI0028A57D7E|nr:MFS transporter [Sphaerochaeta sp. PS]MDT4762721.1 MFS transporter [Sphaerochaeta sp. PS]
MKSVKAYRYRWLILIGLMALLLAVGMQWMNLSPVGRVVNIYYQGQVSSIFSNPVEFLSLAYLLIFVVGSIPASYVIHRLGITVSIRIAAGMIVFGALGKWIYLSNFSIVLFCQLILALAQALVLNSITEIVSRWFPIRERGMAVGMASAAQYFSLGIVMFLSPLMVVTKANAPNYGSGIEAMMGMYAALCSVFAIAAAFLIRENPPSPSSILQREPSVSFLNSFKAMNKIPSLRGLMIIFSVGWGVLITLLVKIDTISEILGFPDSDGRLGIVLLVGGMIGAIVLPSLSDRWRKRKAFFVFCNLCSIPGVLLLVFSQDLGSLLWGNQVFALLGAFIIGFCLLSSIPIGSQYAAELGHGISEEIIQALLLLFSQASGALILIITLVSRGQYAGQLLSGLAALLFAAMMGSTFLKESEVIVTEEERLNQVIEKEIVHLQ